MSDLLICRICLSSNTNLFSYNLFSLKLYYEDIMMKKVSKPDQLPKYFCYECATILNKTHKFKLKCENGQKILQEMSTRGQLTYTDISKIDREDKNLISEIQVSVKTDRIRTLTINHDSDTPPIVAVDIITNDCNDNLPDNDHDFDDSVNDPVNEYSDDDDKAISVIAQELKQDQVIDIDIVKEELNVEELIEELPKEEQKKEVPKKVEPRKEKTKQKAPVVKKKIVKKKIKNNKKKQIEDRKYKFHLTEKKYALDAKNWQKIKFTEEEARKSFEDRAKESKFSNAAYKCHKCYRGFSKEEMLNRHNELRHKESLGERVCRLCLARFRCPYQLHKHIKQHYFRYKCLRCDIICPLESTAYLHDEFHSGFKKVCEFCGREFKKTTTYYTHLRTHRSEHICACCGASFVSEMGLKIHKKLKHVQMEETKTDDDEKTYCDKCDMKFQSREAYEEHLFHSDRHTEGVEYDLDEFTVPRKVLSVKMKKTITKDLRERKDGEPLPIRTKQRVIVRKVNHKKPTTCYQCGKHFITQSACMKHHKQAHPRTSFFAPNERSICEICGISLSPTSVTSHQNLHTKEKEYPCDTCGKIFYATIGLKQHMLTHSDTRPAACTLCDKRFKQTSSLNLHYKTYHLKQPYPKRNLDKRRRHNDLYDEDKYPFEEFLSANRRHV